MLHHTGNAGPLLVPDTASVFLMCSDRQGILLAMHPPRFSPHQLLSEWPDCTVKVWCRCERSTHMPVRLLIERHGDRKVRDVLSRLVCAACRAPPAQAWLVAGMHRSTFGGPEPDWAVKLLKV